MTVYLFLLCGVFPTNGGWTVLLFLAHSRNAGKQESGARKRPEVSWRRKAKNPNRQWKKKKKGFTHIFPTHPKRF